MKQKLRDYQERGLAEVLHAYKTGARSVLMTLPTGGGKTTVFTELASQLKTPVLVLVHRRELATQAANRMREFGVPFGLVMAGEPANPTARVQIASVQTLIRRKAPPAALVICDEAHLSTAQTWQAILDQYPHAKILGCTATPWRLGGKPLVGAYDASVVVATPAELRAQGALCPYNGFSYKAPDLSGVAKVGDEYNQQQSGAAMRAPGIVTDIVEKWKLHASNLSTVVFAVTVEHSKDLTEQFRRAGVRAEHLDGSTPVEQRKAVLKRVESGVTQVLCNVGVAVEGLDIPRLKCCILARPTMSLARAIQMMGRVRRPWNGQTARIHDHAFVIQQHGLPDAERDYTLHARNEQPAPLSHCSQCFAYYSGTQCPACEHVDKEAVERAMFEVIDSAEQVDFSSADEPAPAVERPPVQVEWNEIGRLVSGVFEGAVESQSQWGTQVRFIVKGEKRRYSMPGTVELKAKMRKVRIGDTVHVKYTGNKPLGNGKTQKTFDVECESADDLEGERLREEARRRYEAGETPEALGARFGVSGPTIRAWVVKAGGRLRSNREAHGVHNFTRDQERAATLFDSGLSPIEIAKKLGRAPITVRRWLSDTGRTRTLIDARRLAADRAVDAEQRTRAKRLKADGSSLRAIARELGVNHKTVGTWLRA